MSLSPYGVVVVGTSYGGLEALQELLPGLDRDFRLPVVVVQHRSKDADDGLCEFLEKHSPLPLGEPNDKTRIEGGRVYLAPRDYHLFVEGDHFSLSTDPLVGFARPSIDVLFESAADSYGARAVGVVLTGASRDGAKGLARIKAAGGHAVVQDPDEAASRAMPEAAVAAARVDRVLRLREIAPYLNELCGRPAAGGRHGG
ncbi:MAG: chemotaxis protein CheB [Acidobacteria bacterium]|nr:chemotaxis protein CheB [Acidobacteriota bacterium]